MKHCSANRAQINDHNEQRGKAEKRKSESLHSEICPLDILIGQQSGTGIT